VKTELMAELKPGTRFLSFMKKENHDSGFFANHCLGILRLFSQARKNKPVNSLRTGGNLTKISPLPGHVFPCRLEQFGHCLSRAKFGGMKSLE